MAATYEPIASQTLGSAAATVTFSSIPGTFTDLFLVMNVPSHSGSESNSLIGLRFNGDTGSNYSNTELDGTGSAASSSRNSSLLRYYAFFQDNRAQSYVGQIAIMSYANTNVFKTMLSSFSNPAARVRRGVGLWRNTSAITSIQIRNDNSNTFSSGSTFSLYGIKAA